MEKEKGQKIELPRGFVYPYKHKDSCWKEEEKSILKTPF